MSMLAPQGLPLRAVVLARRRLTHAVAANAAVVLLLIAAITSMVLGGLGVAANAEAALVDQLRRYPEASLTVRFTTDATSRAALRAQDDAARAVVSQSFSGTNAQIVTSRRTAPGDLSLVPARAPTGSGADSVSGSPVLVLDPPKVLAGTWPHGAGEVALRTDDATALGARVGTSLAWAPRQGAAAPLNPPMPATLTVTALVSDDVAWRADGVPLLLDAATAGAPVPGQGWTTGLFVHPDVWTTPGARHARAGLSTLPAEFRQSVPDGATAQVDDQLSPVLDRALAQADAASIGQSRVTGMVGLLALIALVGAGALLAAGLREESVILSARGLSRAQRAAPVAVQTAILAAIAAVPSWALALLVMRAVFGPDGAPGSLGPASSVSSFAGVREAFGATMLALAMLWAGTLLAGFATSTRAASGRRSAAPAALRRTVVMAAAAAWAFAVWQVWSARGDPTRVNESDPVLLVGTAMIGALGAALACLAAFVIGRALLPLLARSRGTTWLGVQNLLRAKGFAQVPWLALSAGLATVLLLVSALANTARSIDATVHRALGGSRVVVAPISPDSLGLPAPPDAIARAGFADTLTALAPGAPVSPVVSAQARVGESPLGLLALDAATAAAVTATSGDAAITAASAAAIMPSLRGKGVAGRRLSLSVEVTRVVNPDPQADPMFAPISTDDLPIRFTAVIAGASGVPVILPIGELALRSSPATAASQRHVAGRGTIAVELPQWGQAPTRLVGLQIQTPTLSSHLTEVRVRPSLDANPNALDGFSRAPLGRDSSSNELVTADPVSDGLLHLVASFGPSATASPLTSYVAAEVSAALAGPSSAGPSSADTATAGATPRGGVVVPVVVRRAGPLASAEVGGTLALDVAGSRVTALVTGEQPQLPGTVNAGPTTTPGAILGPDVLPVDVVTDAGVLAWAQILDQRVPGVPTQWWIGENSSPASTLSESAVRQGAEDVGVKTSGVVVRTVRETLQEVRNNPLLSGAHRALTLASISAALLTLATAAATPLARRRRHRRDAHVLHALGLPQRGITAILLSQFGFAVLLSSLAAVVMAGLVGPLVVPSITDGWLLMVSGESVGQAVAVPGGAWASICLLCASVVLGSALLDGRIVMFRRDRVTSEGES